MVRARRLRRAYNTVPVTAEEEEDQEAAGNEVFEDEAGVDLEAPPAAPSSTRRSGRQRRAYQTVSTTAEEDDEDDDDDEEDYDDALEEEKLEVPGEEEGTKVTVVVMDPAQKKFPIEAYTHWKIEQFKKEGEKTHKVAPPSQRLIYRGQLLQDDKTLEEHGINDDKLIIHLFPKPRVIIQNQSSSSCGAAGGEDDSSTDPNQSSGGGAHIPQIILNADEAERRSSILVLGSTDFLEAQNNVKLFSFLLLVISSIELFNLLLILMGVPPDNSQNGASSTSFDTNEDDFFHINTTTSTDDFFSTGTHASSSSSSQHNQYNSQYDDAIQRELQTWHFSNNFDLAISALGIYVAMLGIRATNETTLRLAKQYLVGTFVVGVLWMIYNYWFTVHVDEEIDQIRREERHNRTNSTSGGNSTIIHNHTHSRFDDDDLAEKTDWDYYQQNLSLMMIPGMVWVLCCVRAWQFQNLLEEAEREAEERIRNELEQHRVPSTTTISNGNNSSGNNNNNNSNAAEGAGDEETPIASGEASSRRQQEGQDLELQNPSAVMT